MKYSLMLAAILATAAHAAPPDPLHVENLQKLTATVESIDQAKRLVTLKAENGLTQTLEVGPDVKNLPQVKAGDKVVVQFYEGLAAELKKKGESPPASEVKSASMAAAAPPGHMPGAVAGTTVNSTVVIDAVDKTANTVTFHGTNGTHTVAVKKPESKQFIAGLKKGDEVDITYTQALAISVEPVGR
jgi:hypothetical protein